VWVTTGVVWVGAVCVLPPEPECEPLVWVTTGLVWVRPVCVLPPEREWEPREPLVCVTTRAWPPEDPVWRVAVGVAGAEPPLVCVTTGAVSELELGAGDVAVEPLADVVTGAPEEE
jgi:hypothetical protein